MPELSILDTNTDLSAPMNANEVRAVIKAQGVYKRARYVAISSFDYVGGGSGFHGALVYSDLTEMRASTHHTNLIVLWTRDKGVTEEGKKFMDAAPIPPAQASTSPSAST